MEKYEYLEIMNALEQETFRLDIEGWLRNELFTWQWWVLVALFILPWILWIKYADRTKLLETSLFGAIVIILTTLLDMAGIALEFWRYPIQFSPILPRAIPFDMAVVPIGFMFLYQLFTTWKTFSLALLIMSGAYAFIGEPVCALMELVQYLKWKYVYSFIYYLIIGFSIRWLVVTFKVLAMKELKKN